MKLLALSLATIALLTGCASDGSFDAVGFGKAVSSVSDAYQSSRPPVVVGYDPSGRPIYGR